MVRKHLPGALVISALALLLAPPASAVPPTISPAPAESATGRFCPDFDVFVNPVSNKEKAITFSTGATIITGHFVDEVTNLSNDRTIRVNASGPGFFAADGSSVIIRGRGLLFGEAGFFGPGSPATLTLVSGQTVIPLDDQGAPTGLSVTGHSVDLCAALAGP
jgi:hypothetical protein